MQSAAVIPHVACPSDPGTREGPSPRILAAVAMAVSLHGLLLFGNGSAVTSTTLHSPSLLVRLIRPPAQQTTKPLVEPSAPVSTKTLSRPEAAPRLMAEARPPVHDTTEKPGGVSPPTETPVVSGSAQPATPSASTSPGSSAEPSRQALADAPDYLPAKLLSVGPRPLQDIEPSYPDAADLRTGKVVLRLLIGDTGHVDDVAVVRANPPGLFDASAIEAFSKALFAPGLAGGVAVKSQITVEVEFVPLDRLSRISGRSY
jgi:protein TonB